MKKILPLILILLLPISAYAHPGKTDRRGGHKCWKNCGEWELRHGEYHLHDKDWKPIRLDKRGIPIKPPEIISEPLPADSATSAKETHVMAETKDKIKRPDEQTTVYNYNTTLHEESILPFNTLLLLILAVFLIIALIFIRKKK